MTDVAEGFVEGVIGQRKFLYDLWGDVVNAASRMESHGMTGRIQITVATRERLAEPFLMGHRGPIEVKGKGEMETWFLDGRTDDSLGIGLPTTGSTQFRPIISDADHPRMPAHWHLRARAEPAMALA